MMTIVNNVIPMTPHIKTRKFRMPNTPGGKKKPPFKRHNGVVTPKKLVFNQLPAGQTNVANTTVLQSVVNDVWAAFVAASDADGPN